MGVLILLLWVGSTVFLVWGHQGPGLAEAQAINVDRAPGLVEGDEWQTLYLKGKRVGFVHMEKRRDAEGWKLGYELLLELEVMKSNHRIRSDLDARLDSMLTLKGFEFALDGGEGGRIKVSGSVEGKDVAMEIATGGMITKQTVNLPNEPRLAMTNRALLASEGLKVGRSFETPFFDPSTMSERSVRVEVIGTEKLHILGRTVDAFVLRQHLEGLELHAWVTAAGDVLKEELPLGLVAVRETEEEARFGMGVTHGGMGSSQVVDASQDQDIISMTAPVLEGRFPVAQERLTSAAFELDVLPRGPFVLDGRRQTLQGKVVRVSRETIPASSSPPDPKTVPAGALEADALIQSDHPAIRSKAREVVGASTDPVQQVRSIMRWLAENMNQTNVVGVPSALETLQSMRGDCNEHTTLFTALARSLGIPTEVAVGMAHKDGRFYYHAWPEVMLGGAWVAVDPTWGQMPADVTHLRFVRGNLREQLAMFNVIGRVKRVKLVDAEGEP